jgi:hypothetical protein
MKHIASFFALVVVAALASCAGDKGAKAYEDFGGRWMQAQHDYCSTNLFVAESGMLAFREWLSDTNHVTEPAMSRDMALFKIDGRLFLLEEYVGDSRQADKFCEESMQAWNRYVEHLRTLALPPAAHPLQPISSKEQLRDLLARQDKGLDVGWMMPNTALEPTPTAP